MDFVSPPTTESSSQAVSDQEITSTVNSIILDDLALRFSWPDYCVFCLMLLLSASIGVYYGFFAKRSVVDYEPGEAVRPSMELAHLAGGSGLTPFPVAMSLVASYISGVTMVGTPSEIYYHGMQYWVVNVGIVFMAFTLAYIFLPVFLNLSIMSSYEYLELRFNRHVRAAACAMFVLDEILFLPVILYVPSLTFSQVTGFNIHLIGAIVCAVCIFYTSVGGLRAVVWADTLQIILMFSSLLVVVIVGLVKVGGIGVVWNRAVEGERVEIFNFDPNPLERHTVWTLVIGGYVYWTSYNAVNQTMVQRYLALPSLKDARLSMVYFTIGILLFVTFCCSAGLLIYSTYYNCDPLEAKLIDTGDQLLPLYVMHTAHHIFGLPGLFIAGVFSAALSSLSTVLNSTTCVIMRDLLESYFHVEFQSSWTVGILARGLVVALGLVAIGGIYIVSKLGGILQVAYTISAVAAGSTFGVFTLGLTCPFANTKGALAGGLAAVLLMSWCCIGSQMATATGQLVERPLPIAMDACPSVPLSNISAQTMSQIHLEYAGTTQSGSPTLQEDKKDEVFALYRLSYMYFSSVGLLSVMVVGTLVSLCTGRTDESKLDENLFAPPVRRWLLRRRKERQEAQAAKASKEEENEVEINPMELSSLSQSGVESNGRSPVGENPRYPENVELL
ncbi:sodium-coupled monocarboxylate transporter 1-like [Hetaerina americana]|uniref:sodium-coupled monocarboxylate transporter 1-like n=1 Tax=Hetaerina americana TaxID=62018 RepID=UPI003A7F23A2